MGKRKAGILQTLEKTIVNLQTGMTLPLYNIKEK
jgi:hypothetical protein